MYKLIDRNNKVLTILYKLHVRIFLKPCTLSLFYIIQNIENVITHNTIKS